MTTLRRTLAAGVALAAVIGAVAPAPVAASPNLPLLRLSITATGGNPNQQTFASDVSSDGRRTVLFSFASNLAPGDTNGAQDIFVRDAVDSTTVRVSVSDTEQQANGWSFPGAITADGTKVVFSSDATNLVTGDTNGAADLFLRDLAAGTTTRVSLAGDGGQLAGGIGSDWNLSANGRYLVFSSSSPTLSVTSSNLFVRDLVTGTVERVTRSSTGGEPDDYSQNASVTDDGRYVVFESLATNLVAGVGTVDYPLIYRRDLQTDTNQLVTPSITGGAPDAFTRSPAMSRNGRYVIFYSTATNLTASGTGHVYRRDITAGTTALVGISDTEQTLDSFSEPLGISGDGNVIAFVSWAENATRDTPPGADIFVREVSSGTTRQLSLSTTGGLANGSSDGIGAISDSGRYVVFSSDASNLVSNDNNQGSDVFRADLAHVPASPATPTVSPGLAPTVRWTTPKANGWPAPTGYRVTAFRGAADQSPDGTLTVGAATRQLAFPGLVPGAAYRFKVAATNGEGIGPDSEYTAFAVPPFVGLDDSKGALTWLYRWLANRSPTAAEVGTAGTQLAIGQTTAQAIASPLVDSPWMKGKVQPVIRLSRAYYLRSPDSDGLRFWVGRVGAGWTLARASQSFATSSEFTAKYGRLTNRAFVSLLYQNVMERAADRGGLDYWSKQLDRGVSRGQVMVGFSESSEYIRRNRNLVEATAISHALLGRVPTQAEGSSWYFSERIDVIDAIISSTAFETRVRAL